MNIKFARDGVDLAVYPEESVPALLVSGALRPTDLFWQDGMEGWALVQSKWSARPTGLDELISAGWHIIADGPSGVQLAAPKKMRGLDQACAVIGVICLFFSWPLGLFLFVLAGFDYAFFTKPATKFLPR